MKHLHLKECQSTFSELKKHIDYGSVLVSTQLQTGGRGRGNNSWDFFKNSVAMSFNILPHKERTLTALEIGILITQFFSKNFSINLSLKWPNDIIKNNKKVGGILIESFADHLLVGIGLNTILDDSETFNDYKVSAGVIFDDNNSFSRESLCYELATYIHSNRIKEASQVKVLYDKICFHINKKIEIYDGDNIIGIFKGINKDGSAIIENDIELKNVYSGSLRLLI